MTSGMARSSFGGQFPNRFLEAGHSLAGEAEDVEEVDPEGFGLGVLGSGIRPLPGEGQGAAADFVPGKGHPDSRAYF